MSQSTTSQTCTKRAVERYTPAPRQSTAPIGADAFRAAFLPDTSAVARIRASTAAFLRRFGLTGPVASSVVLVVSELVTNAIKHGYGEVELEIRVVSGTISVSVTDENPAPAVLKQPGPDDTSGRGMALVEAYADRWGSTGEETWCEFRHDRAGSAA
ncbi:ATP-binding protein [Streptomyces ardesiacus]|uniref:ATP-binding protein n=1 Tax=Streptomyces ardesiacus TaxID=285564 RepID=A0ABW8H5C4_9ACTN